MGWAEYQNYYYSLPSMIRRRQQLAKRTYELPSEMTGFGPGYIAARSDSKAPKMSALWKTRVG